jgi:hypothetical protein
MKNQIIRVNTKKGLLAGFECAKDFPGTTEITLVRKTGETIYKLRPFNSTYYAQFLPFKKVYEFKGSERKFNLFIENSKSKIKRTKATDLLA